MKMLIATMLAALSLMLSACSTTISSKVTTFHEWPSTLPEKTFSFESPKTQIADLEYGSYQKMVATELQRLGLSEVKQASAAKLRVAIDYNTALRTGVVSQLARTDPFMRGYIASPFRPFGLRYRGFGRDPFWMDDFGEYYQWEVTIYQRQLHIKIVDISTNKAVYETTVDNVGLEPTTAVIMPYLIQSAFTEFPGKSGVSHQVDLKVKPNTK